MSLNDRRVALDIPLEWTIWRPYVLSGSVATSNVNRTHEERDWFPKDPLDQPDFDQNNAFPALKPNIDVFGVPRRCRSQRGWYQVVPPLARHMLFPQVAAHAPHATGADIPEELFPHILNHLQHGGGRIEGSRENLPRIEVTKKQLGACALVSRYWAPFCQKRIFRHICLRNWADIVQLDAFFRDPRSRVARYASQVRFEATLADAPWLHLVPALERLMDNRMDEVCVVLTGPLPRGHPAVRSLHAALPRAPPAFLRGIYDITLRAVHLRRLDDLAHLVWEAHALGWLQCEQVTWDAKQTDVARLQRGATARRHAQALRGEFVGCSMDWAVVWLMNMPLLCRAPQLPVEEFAALGTLCEVIASGVGAYKLRCWPVELFQNRKLTIVSFTIPGPFKKPTFRGQVIRLHVYVQEPPPATLSQGEAVQRILHISEIDILMQEDEIELISGINWPALEEAALLFPSLERFKLCFYNQAHLRKMASEPWTQRFSRLVEANKFVLQPKYP